MIDTPIDAFIRDPAGRYVVVGSCIIWCQTRSLCGLYFWGRPSADDLLEVARICDAYPSAMATPFDVVSDGREVEALDGDALAVQMAWLWRQGATLLERARIWSIVAEGSVAARLARLMPSFNASERFQVTTDAGEAFRAVRGEAGAGLLAEVEAIAAQRRGLARELHVIRALLGRRLDARLEDAARELRMSPRSLQRWLTRHGVSFHDEQVAARFAAACELLRASDLKVAAIAAQVGISERAITMLFRSQTGLTPTAWRARERG